MSADTVAAEQAATRAAQILDRLALQVRDGTVEYAWSMLDALEAARKSQRRALELLRD